MSLRIEDLEHRYEDRGPATLHVPRYALEDGEQACLVGGSGSGKTTFLNLVAGILAPRRGVVRHGETDIAALGEAARDRFRARRIGYVFQTFNLLQGLSALENLLLPLGFAGVRGEEARTRALETLGRVGVGALADSRPARMSVGEQQRVAIARALVNGPALVLADEPTANLDEENAERALDLLRGSVAEAGASLLLVTHTRSVRDRFDRVETMAEISA
ncbi:MAG: ABC transporter ATP-binding protein [Planctomycetota bacterium]